MIEDLYEKFQTHKSEYADNLRLRIWRSLSWLEKANKTDDEDIKFITLWIAFNAVYARELEFSSTEKGEFRRFIQAISRLDKDQKIYQMVWNTYSGSIRLLLDNKYIFQPFWDSHNGKISQSEWEDQFSRAKLKVNKALVSKDTDKILEILFNSLYTLRNQLVHGGATHNSRVNRQQVKDGNAILSSLLPLIIEIMMCHHDKINWGKPFYPPISV